GRGNGHTPRSADAVFHGQANTTIGPKRTRHPLALPAFVILPGRPQSLQRQTAWRLVLRVLHGQHSVHAHPHGKEFGLVCRLGDDFPVDLQIRAVIMLPIPAENSCPARLRVCGAKWPAPSPVRRAEYAVLQTYMLRPQDWPVLLPLSFIAPLKRVAVCLFVIGYFLASARFVWHNPETWQRKLSTAT